MGENIIQLIKFCEHLELSHKLTENGDSNRNYANLASVTVSESLVDSANVQRNQVRNASGDIFLYPGNVFMLMRNVTCCGGKT